MTVSRRTSLCKHVWVSKVHKAKSSGVVRTDFHSLILIPVSDWRSQALIPCSDSFFFSHFPSSGFLYRSVLWSTLKTSGSCGSNKADLISWMAASLLSSHTLYPWSPPSRYPDSPDLMITLTSDAKCQSLTHKKVQIHGQTSSLFHGQPFLMVLSVKKPNTSRISHRDRNLRRSDSRPAPASDAITLQNNRVLSMI